MYLTKAEVVGKRVAQVLQSPWVQYDEVSVCSGFVRLENGTLFELCSSDASPSVLLALKDVGAELQVSDFNDVCSGAVVQDVVTTEYWPTIGLVLSNGILLYMNAPTPFRFGPIATDIGDRYELSDCQSIWS